jgi:hypothetical protein
LVSRALYRIAQFRRALNPHVTPSELKAAQQTLGPALYPLFQSMHQADQRHALDVFEFLLNSGQSDRAILQAALIHDCGKGRLAGAELRLWHRVVHVLLHPLPPLARLAAGASSGLAALRDHGEKTLTLARDYGASDEVIGLLSQAEGFAALDARGKALKRADDAC